MSIQHHVFLSYSRKDSDLMQKIRDDLRAEGLSVWTDEGIEPGTPLWDQAIEQGMDYAGCMVVILTPRTKNANGVRKEIHYAQGRKLHIVPLMADGDESNAVPWTLAGWQWIDIRYNYISGVESLVESVCKHLGVESATQQRERQALEETERKAREAAQKKAEQEQQAENERIAREEAEKERKARDEGVRLRKERDAAQQAERERIASAPKPAASQPPPTAKSQTPVETPLSKPPASDSKPSSQPQESTPTSTAPVIETMTDKRLKGTNPRDQLRLLWWLFINPAAYLDYRTRGNYGAPRNATTWLSSSLICLPVLIILIGIVLHSSFSYNPEQQFFWWLWLLPFAGYFLTVIVQLFFADYRRAFWGFMVCASLMYAAGFLAAVNITSLITVVVVAGRTFIYPELLNVIAFAAAYGTAIAVTLHIFSAKLGKTRWAVSAVVALTAYAVTNLPILFYGIRSLLPVDFVAAVTALLAFICAAYVIPRNLNVGRSSLLSKVLFVILALLFATLVVTFWFGEWRYIPQL